MSKYYKAEDVIKVYNEAVQELVEAEMKEFDLGDFTECSFNTTQLKLIPRKIENLPTIEVSEDVISRGDLISDLAGIWDTYTPNNMIDFQDMLEDIDYKIRNAPSVAPKPKEGQWIDIGLTTHSYKCSVCGRMLVNITDGKKTVAKNYPYCHCGAKMKGAAE